MEEVKKVCSKCNEETHQLITGELCRRCYNAIWRTGTTKPKYQMVRRCCEQCGRMFGHKTKLICLTCRRMNAPYYKPPKPKPGTRCVKKLVDMTKDEKELIRRLLVKYKWGLLNEVDYFKAVSIFCDYSFTYGEIDRFEVSKQIDIIMDRLKKLFEHSIV